MKNITGVGRCVVQVSGIIIKATIDQSTAEAPPGHDMISNPPF